MLQVRGCSSRPREDFASAWSAGTGNARCVHGTAPGSAEARNLVRQVRPWR
jgi:hypothetical protein